jgi:hypothetical protein
LVWIWEEGKQGSPVVKINVDIGHMLPRWLWLWFGLDLILTRIASSDVSFSSRYFSIVRYRTYKSIINIILRLERNIHVHFRHSEFENG